MNEWSPKISNGQETLQHVRYEKAVFSKVRRKLAPGTGYELKSPRKVMILKGMYFLPDGRRKVHQKL